MAAPNGSAASGSWSSARHETRASAKTLPRQIQVRQRPLKNDPDPARLRQVRLTASHAPLHVADEVSQLFFAIARNEDPGIALRWHCKARLERIPGNHRFLDPRQQIVDALVEPGGQDALRRDDVELHDPLQASEQIDVRYPEAVGVGSLVGRRHDDVPMRLEVLGCQREPPEAMLVDHAGLTGAALVIAERGREEPRLGEQPCGAAVDPGARLEGFDHEPLERNPECARGDAARRRTTASRR